MPFTSRLVHLNLITNPPLNKSEADQTLRNTFPKTRIINSYKNQNCSYYYLIISQPVDHLNFHRLSGRPQSYHVNFRFRRRARREGGTNQQRKIILSIYSPARKLYSNTYKNTVISQNYLNTLII